MKKVFLLGAMVYALGMMTACKSATKTEDDTAHFTDTIQSPDTVYVEKNVEVTQNGDSTYFDFLPKEEYHLIIKGALKYDKNNGGSLDSAIREYSDEIIPVDSIKKWWYSVE